MKLLKFIFFSLIILIVLVCVGLFIFAATFDVNKYLPAIEKAVARTINREVHIGYGHLALDVGGLSLKLKDISVSDDPIFSRNNFLSLDAVYFRLDVMRLIVKREIYGTHVVLLSPKISMIRLPHGDFNFQTMMGPSVKPSPHSLAVPPPPASDAKTPVVAAIPPVFIQSVFMSHAQLTYDDENTQMPLHITVSDADVNIDKFSLDTPFDFKIRLSAWAKGGHNIKATGRCRLDIAKSAVYIRDLHIKSDLSQWDVQKIKTISPVLGKSFVWPQEIKGDVSVDIPELYASSKGLQGLSLRMDCANGYIKLREILSAIDQITFKVESDLNSLSIRQLQAHIGSGVLVAQADVQGILTLPTYSFQIQSKAVKVEELVDQSKAPCVLEAQVNGEFSGQGERFDPKAMLEAFRGQGNLALTNAKVKKFNILNVILDKLNFIPGFGPVIETAVETSVPSAIKAKLDTDTVVLAKAEGQIKVKNKIMTLENAQITSQLFSISAQGAIDFDLNTHIDVRTYVATDLSMALTRSARPLRGLLDEKNCLYIPGTILGKAPFSVGYRVSMDYITKKLAVSEASQQLQKVFKKNPAIGNILNAVLGSKQSTNTEGQGQEDASNKLINGVLNTIFR